MPKDYDPTSPLTTGTSDGPSAGGLHGTDSTLHPFLEERASIEALAIGGIDRQELLGALDRFKIKRSAHAKYMLASQDFQTSADPKLIEVVTLTIGDLGIKSDFPTTAEIDALREELGLFPLPAEAAIHYLLQKGDELKIGDTLWMRTKPIADTNNRLREFEVARNSDGLSLHGHWTEPSFGWPPTDRLAFGLAESK